MASLENHIATNIFYRVNHKGETVQWQQENESAVTHRADAVAIIQRTINFWLPKITTDLINEQGMSIEVARALAQDHFERTLLKMILTSPFLRRWGLKIEDFTFTPEF